MTSVFGVYSCSIARTESSSVQLNEYKINMKKYLQIYFRHSLKSYSENSSGTFFSNRSNGILMSINLFIVTYRCIYFCKYFSHQIQTKALS